MQNQSIRIRPKAFDHKLIDRSAREIVETVSNALVQRSKDQFPCQSKNTKLPSSFPPTKTKTQETNTEIRTHKRTLDILEPSEKTLDAS